MAVTMKTTVAQGTQDVIKNTTQVTIKTTVTSTYGSFNDYQKPGTYKIYKNSSKGSLLSEGSFTSKIGKNTDTIILNKTVSLTHDVDGTLDIVVVVEFSTGLNAGDITNTVSKSLTTIARQSTVTAVACDIGASTVITINRNASTFTHTLAYGYGLSPSALNNIVSKTTLTSYGWNVPEEAYQKCPNAKYIDITIRCYTYSGDSLIGYSDCSFKATANKDESEPLVSLRVVEDINPHSLALTGDKTRLIRGVSTLSYEVEATARNEATLKSVAISNGTVNLATYIGQIEKVTSGNVKATVTDSRGYSGLDEAVLTLVDYIPVSIGATVKWNSPTNNTIDIMLSGNYSDIDFGAVVNTLKLQYKVIPKSFYDTNINNLTYAPYIDIPVEIKVSQGKYTAEFSITKTTTSQDGTAIDLDYREAYSFGFRVMDKVSDNSSGNPHKSVAKHIAPTVPIFDWSKDDFNFNVPVLFGDISLSGAAKALTYNYALECSAVAGSGWKVNSFNANLTGGILRCYLNVTRNAQTGSGDIVNEEVLTVSITHNGKVRALYGASFITSSVGPVASLYTDNTSVDEKDLSFKVYLASTTANTLNLNALINLPVSIDTNAY